MNPIPPPTSSDKIRIEVDAALEDLIPTFLANRRRDLDAMRDAIAGKNHQVIKTLGHRMRGDGGGYGFDAISDIGGALEAAAARQDWDGIARQMEKLTDYLNRVDVVFVG